MNILMFDYEYPPLGGGGGVVHELIAEELATRHGVTVVTSAGPGLSDREMRAGVEIVRVPVWGRSERSVASMQSMLTFPPAAWLAGRELLKARRYDLVNAHFAVPTGPGSLPLARLAGLPHVLSIHGGDIFDPSKRASPHRIPPLRWAVTELLKRSDRVVAQSTDTREKALHYYAAGRDIDVIPLGIRRPPPGSGDRRSLNLPEDRFLVSTVGRLVRRKGLDNLLAALARPVCDNVHLVVVGSGPERGDLEELAEALGMAGRVTFTGWADEATKWQILRASDAYVSATLHEGFGLMFLEAMAVGVPVVTSNHGGHTDFLKDGVTGYLVPPSNDEALSEAVARLAGDVEAAARMGAANRELFESRYTIQHCAGAYEDLFNEVLGGGQIPDPDADPGQAEAGATGGADRSRGRSAMAVGV